VDLNGLGVKLETFLVDEEFLDILALIALELDHFAHFRVVDDGAIASCVANALASDDRLTGGVMRQGVRRTELLLDDLENLLLIEFLRKTLNGGQGFTSITLCEATCEFSLQFGRNRGGGRSA
jgi:hypothetical protein